jgi:hypothetical protein
MRNLLIARTYHAGLAQDAAAHDLPFILAPLGYEPPCDHALVVEPEAVVVPWDLVPFGLRFVERWDIAVPLWRYGVLAADIGTPEERARTQAVIRDLRVLLYCHELLFFRDDAPARDFLAAWRDECATGDERRLAFLRALYRVKPRLCALPCNWMREVGHTDAHRAASASPLVDGTATDLEKRIATIRNRHPRAIVRARGNSTAPRRR